MLEIELEQCQYLGPAGDPVKQIRHAGWRVLVTVLDQFDERTFRYRLDVDFDGRVIGSRVGLPAEREPLRSSRLAHLALVLASVFLEAPVLPAEMHHSTGPRVDGRAGGKPLIQPTTSRDGIIDAFRLHTHQGG